MKVLIREDELLDQFRSELAASKEFDLAMALISEDGLRLIEDALVSFFRRKGRCRILFGIDLAMTPDAIARLIELRDAHPDALDVRYFRSKDVSEFHAKFASFRCQQESGARSMVHRSGLSWCRDRACQTLSLHRKGPSTFKRPSPRGGRLEPGRGRKPAEKG